MPIAGCSRPNPPSQGGGAGSPGGGTVQACCPPCPAYDSVDTTIDVETYNCAGLAHRTYTYMSLSEAKRRLSAGSSISCSSQCSPCQVKHWLWEYDLHLEDADGNHLTRGSNRDFHTVAGRCDNQGNDPADVRSKNGARPLEGPGRGQSFRPANRDEARSNDRHAVIARDSRGRPIYKVRTNFTETCYCLPCP